MAEQRIKLFEKVGFWMGLIALAVAFVPGVPEALAAKGIGMVAAWLILTVGAAAIEYLSGRRWPRIIGIALIVAVLSGVALTMVARFERERMVKRVETPEPKFVAIIEGVNTATPIVDQDNGRDDTSILLVVRLINKGAPSIATGWGLMVTIPGHEPMVAELAHMKSDYRVKQPDGSMRIYSPADALYNKTVGQPIATYGNADGILVFVLPHLPTVNIVSGTRLTLSFSDAKPSSYSFSITLTEKDSHGLPYYEGLKSPQ